MARRPPRIRAASEPVVPDACREDTGDVGDLTWWDGVDDQARAWLIAHNGEAVAPDVLDQTVANEE